MPYISIHGMGCWPSDCAPLDGVLDVCPHAMLHTVPHIKRATEITRRFCIRKSPKISLGINPAAEWMFRQESAVMHDYKGNSSVGRSAFALVMDCPLHLPAFAVVMRGLPSPVEVARGNIFPDHALQELRAIRPRGVALQDHLAVLEFADEVEIRALVVDP